ncbi:MAG TPA: DUF4159 domain-containing protein [Ignavibacteriales bacterium]|nr:DUF4159 domain-containing protein [Ignavibacteriales bacterium]
MNLRFFIKILIVLAAVNINIFAQNEPAFQIARVKYNGGGDWYNDPSEEVNLLKYVSEHTNIKVKADYVFVDLNSDDIFSYPFLYLTGHGNIVLSDNEVTRLRSYLENGGFLYVDDDYGLDKAFRREIKRVFPDKELVELPFSYGLYHCFYDFPAGVPKTHEHDGKKPQGFGIFLNERLAVYYTYESNPSDGWADPEVHGDPPAKREEALRFGTNLVVWALSH